MFPVWWYSRGFLEQANSTWMFIQNRQKALALSVWVKNVFTPMYGQTDWQGRLVSIFMRLVQIVFRSIVMIVFVIIGIFRLLLWLILPLFVLYEIFFQLL